VRVWILASWRHAWLRGLAETTARSPRDEVPLRTFYNSLTQQYEQMPLTRFQQLLKYGEIQETVSWRLDGPPERIFRLV